MGADLVIYTCAHPSNLGLTEAEGKEWLRKYAFSATRQLLDAFFESFGDGNGDLHSHYSDAVGDGNIEHLAQSQKEDASVDPELDWGRSEFWARLEAAYGDTVENNGVRDVTDLVFGGLTYMVSGGMTWGDEPTESGPLLSLLDWTGIFDSVQPDGEIRKGVLDLSTTHIPYSFLERQVPDLDVHWRCQSHDAGWIVFLGDEDDDTKAPEWFRPVLKLARALGCTFVNFDKDGPITTLIPVYTETST